MLIISLGNFKLETTISTIIRKKNQIRQKDAGQILI